MMACIDSVKAVIEVGDTVQDAAGNNHTVAQVGRFVIETSAGILLRAKETTKQ